MLYETQNMSPTIKYASPNYIGDPTWFLDIGASDHVTFDTLNFTISIESTRNEQL